MARHRAYRPTKAENEVFDYRKLSDITNAARDMVRKIMPYMALQLSAQEFIAGWINPEHTAALNTTMSLIGHVGDTGTGTKLYLPDGNNITVSVDFGQNIPPIILPRYVKDGLQPTCPDDLREKITSWVTDFADIAAKLRDVQVALEFLNTRCGDTAAFALALPCLPHLMLSAFTNVDSREHKAAMRLREITKFGRLPSLLPEQRTRLRDISALVMSATLTDGQPTIYNKARKGDAVIGSSGVHNFSSQNRHETVFADGYGDTD